MKDFALRHVAAWRWRILAFALLMIGAAVGLACLIAMAAFPLLAGIPADGLISALAATAFLVALPVVRMRPV